MQVIESLGGPYIFIDSRSASTWSGADGRGFFDKGTGATDYEILERFLELRSNVASIEGKKSSAMIIVPPLDLALIESGKDYALMAQVHYADPDWSFSAAKRSDLTQPRSTRKYHFTQTGWSISCSMQHILPKRPKIHA